MNQSQSEFKNILQEIHTKIDKRYRCQAGGGALAAAGREGRVYSILTAEAGIGPGDCSRKVQQVYGLNLGVDEIIAIMKRSAIGHPNERRIVIGHANKLADEFVAAMRGSAESYKHFAEFKKKLPEGTFFERKNCFEKMLRLILISVFTRYSDLFSEEDTEVVLNISDTLCKYCVYDIEEIVGYAYGFPMYRKNAGAGGRQGKKFSFHELLEKNGRLEGELERVNGMLQELQEDFDRQLSETKVQELTEFFSRLNSDRYGCIIDELFSLRRGIEKLRRENYGLPHEISGLMIMATKLLAFVKDSHIDPMMRLGAVIEVKAADAENCIYEGTPFTGSDEAKTVRVLSPGWIYRDKEIQISRPKLKEEK